MPGVKNNRRTQYTRRQLKEALIRLLEHQPLAAITVTELCREADVNRGTFYLHYASPAALFASIEQELVDTVRPLIHSGTATIDQWLPPILEVIQSEETATLIIIRNIHASPLLQAVLAPVKEETLAQYRELYHETDPAVLDYYYEFFFSGAVRVVTKWLASGAQESPQTIARVIQNAIRQTPA
ncbi:TetR/AcrR family transcriptional regulator [Schleiferilactobacillus shenzhenensis]|uniref:TetR/AcrR family transcriptional regulator n=1 Tax=Schleiferilactobacillus shenzhenensis TaxID=1231337 RepID=UPI00042795C6|nr:TetR/AcrR family transcriptional regulator [Schleiferilactobacillus shenzhenensis]